jgi:hypothetical protein
MMKKRFFIGIAIFSVGIVMALGIGTISNILIQTRKFKPTLSLHGEGAIYLKYTDAMGQSTQETVCGYTEYLSGYSKVMITNEDTTVVQQCN